LKDAAPSDRPPHRTHRTWVCGEAEHTFTVDRDEAAAAAGLERLLDRLCAEHAEYADPLGEPAAALARRIEGVAAALERGAAGSARAADEASLGFWALAHDADGATGLSGYGGLADCRLAATWQYFGPPGAPPACATRCLGAALCSVCRRRGARHADGRGGRQRQSGHACARRG